MNTKTNSCLFASLLLISNTTIAASSDDVLTNATGDAARGATIGAIAGDAEKGAATGAAGGAVFGGMHRANENTIAGQDLARGTSEGATIGAIAGDAEKGAAEGALMGDLRRRQRLRALPGRR